MQKQNMKISGSSSMPGGNYGKVNVSGCGKVIGDIKAEQLTCSGVAKIEGTASVGNLTCSGTCSFKEDLIVTNKAMFSGASKVSGKCTCHHMECSGVTKLEQNLSCDTLRLSGVLKVYGGVEAETLQLDGVIGIDGLLNAEHISIRSRDCSMIKEIGCSKIQVRRGHISFWSHLFHPHRKSLETSIIECDDCELENTRADIVRGKQIIIKKGCDIRRVEYSDTCDIAKGCVQEVVKI